MNLELASRLCSPVSGQALALQDGAFVSPDGGESYPVSDEGVPLFAGASISDDAKNHQAHYDMVAKEYVDNLS